MPMVTVMENYQLRKTTPIQYLLVKCMFLIYLQEVIRKNFRHNLKDDYQYETKHLEINHVFERCY